MSTTYVFKAIDLTGRQASGEVKDAEELGRALKSFFKKNKLPKRNVRIGVANNRIGIRTIELQGIVTQQLMPTADGQGRCVGVEVLVPTPAVRNLIREGKTHQIYSALQTGASHGMQTMDTSLVELVRAGKISRELAEARSSAPEELRRLMGTVRAA